MPSCSKRTWYIIAGVSSLLVAVIITAVVLAVVIPKAKSKDNSKKEELDKKSFYIPENENSSSNGSNYVSMSPRILDEASNVFLNVFFPDLSVDLSDVEYDLYTQKNKNNSFLITNNNISILSHSYFDPQKRVVFVCHGWGNNRSSNIYKFMIPAIIEHHDVNLFFVNWEKRAARMYQVACRYVKSVGKIVGDFINTIQSTYHLTGASFILIGHSLGAQVIGNAGAEVKSKVKHIVGLDPATPLFTYARTDNRLDRSDGLFVQVIHTDGGRLGFLRSLGHVDYYPNGGKRQPGCKASFDLSYFKGSCAHERAFLYYAESLIRGPVFRAYKCDMHWTWVTEEPSASCNKSIVSFMGQLEHDTSITGDFYLETNGDPPYGKG